MVTKIQCAFCGIELENFQEQCPHCGEHDVGWLDSVGGWHSGGCGTSPDGTECGECAMLDCADCSVWKKHQTQTQKYGSWKCEECGEELEIWLDKEELEDIHLIMWHCTECGCDYESSWTAEDGMVSFERKFWG